MRENPVCKNQPHPLRSDGHGHALKSKSLWDRHEEGVHERATVVGPILGHMAAGSADRRGILHRPVGDVVRRVTRAAITRRWQR